MPSRVGRRIAVFLDGTSNTPEELRHVDAKGSLLDPPPITNVVRLLRGVVTDDSGTDVPQIIGYFRGVGTEGSRATKLLDSVVGRGLSRTVLDAYRFISHNLEWTDATHAKVGQDEIYLFGFSRGAFAARALAGFLDRLGLIRKEGLWLLPYFFDHYQKLLLTGKRFDSRVLRTWEDQVHPEYRSIPVKFLGVWDTVGAIGLPIRGMSWVTIDHKKLYDTSLTKNVTHACQALAIHELRRPFKPVFWTRRSSPSQVLNQVWFAGAHANVGGGYRQTGLSSFALDWMAYQARKAGLKLDLNYIKEEVSPGDLGEPIALSRRVGHGETGLLRSRKLYRRVFERPMTLGEINSYLQKFFHGQAMDPGVHSEMKVHWSALDRLESAAPYQDEAKHFERLDELASTLPVVPKSETLA